MLDDFEIEQSQDLAGAKQAIVRLFNLVEELAVENRQLRQEKQQLRDEINRLKGEQGQRAQSRGTIPRNESGTSPRPERRPVRRVASR